MGYYPRKNYSNKASVCYKNFCANLYGRNAEIVNTIAIITAVIGSVMYLNKLAKSM